VEAAAAISTGYMRRRASLDDAVRPARNELLGHCHPTATATVRSVARLWPMAAITKSMKHAPSPQASAATDRAHRVGTARRASREEVDESAAVKQFLYPQRLDLRDADTGETRPRSFRRRQEEPPDVGPGSASGRAGTPTEMAAQ